MAIVAVFMCTPLSTYVSRLIPRIDAVSFAWRWLVIATCCTSLVVAAAIDRISVLKAVSPAVSWVTRIALAAALALNVWCTIQRVMLPTGSQPSLSLPPSFLEAGFIPAGALPPQHMSAGPQATLAPAAGEVQVIRWDPLQREVRVDARQSATLKLKTYNFPGWIARIDGQPAQLSSDTSGAQTVNLPPGEHTVEVLFVNTPPRTFGGAMTGAGFLLLCGVVAADFVMRRRSRARTEEVEPEENRPEAPARIQNGPGDEGTPSSIEH